MTSRRKQRTTHLDDVGPGLTETGDVEVFKSSTGAAFFRPSIRPRAWDRLDPFEQELLSELQLHAANIHQLQGHLEELVREARETRVSWDLIGWSVGTTGNAARQRWGSEQPEG